jgi:hypothetical protein
MEERIAQMQVDLDCVLKDNEDKNNEIASLMLELKLQQIKNDSLYYGVKSASEESKENEFQFLQSKNAIDILKEYSKT